MKSLIFAFALIGSCFGGSLVITPLLDDNHPCIAENLKDTHRYICDKEANVICLDGWREPENLEDRKLTNPCPIPVCELNNQTCQNGKCIRPDICACDVGWSGYLCDQCVCLPGCAHGSCEYKFECNCDTNEDGVPLYMGALCNMPNCPDCNPNNSICLEPFVCSCIDGWEGKNCDICQPLRGCVNGDCDSNRPGTCKCRDGWTGHLCDEPICSVGCDLENGYCNEPYTCTCRTGWANENCTQCKTYWNCPESGTCVEPNQCICDSNTASPSVDIYGLCNRDDINGPVYGPYQDCSNPCVENARVGQGPGVRSREVRWCPPSGCSVTEEFCYGTRSWTFVESGSSDFQNCIFSTGNSELETSTSQQPITAQDSETNSQSEESTSIGFFTVKIGPVSTTTEAPTK